MADIGYTVSYGAADAYAVFPGNLRASQDSVIELIELIMPPPMAMDERGRVAPIRR
jgi:hypothetical protein